jgi:hypothetical protein
MSHRPLGGVSTCARYCFTRGAWLRLAHQEVVSAPALLQYWLAAPGGGGLLGQGRARLSQAPGLRRRPSTRRTRRGGGGGRSDFRVVRRATARGIGWVSEGRRGETSAAAAAAEAEAAVASHRARLRLARTTVAGEEGAAIGASLVPRQVVEVSPRARLRQVVVARVDSRLRRVTDILMAGMVGVTWDRLPDTRVIRRGVITQVRLRVVAWARPMM